MFFSLKVASLIFWSNLSSWSLWLVRVGHLTQSKVIRADPGVFAGALGDEVYSFSLFLNLADESQVLQERTMCRQPEWEGSQCRRKLSQWERERVQNHISGLESRCAQSSSNSHNFYFMSLLWLLSGFPGGLLRSEQSTCSVGDMGEITWTEEPPGLQFIGSQRVTRNLATKQQLHLLSWVLLIQDSVTYNPESSKMHMVSTEPCDFLWSRFLGAQRPFCVNWVTSGHLHIVKPAIPFLKLLFFFYFT